MLIFCQNTLISPTYLEILSEFNPVLISQKEDLKKLTNYENSKIWLAHYTSETDYKGEYMMWQMTSSCKINGITENTVDIDILYK